MSVENFIPTLWNSVIQQEHDRVSIVRLIANTDSEGEIKQAGDQVIFPGLIDPTITAYTGTVSFEDIEDGSVTMNVDQQNYFAFKATDIDQAQAKANFKTAQTARAGSLLAQAQDEYVLGLYAQAGNTVTDTTTDTSTVLSVISQASRLLSENDTPTQGRWLVIAPWMAEKLELAQVVFEVGTGLATGVQWANRFGFTIYVSNNVTNPTGSTGHITHCLAGGMNAIGFANQLTETEALRLEGSFSDGVRGLDVFGGKIVRPNDLVHLALTYAAETAI